MRAAIKADVPTDLEIDAGTEDAQVAARRFSRTYRGYRGRLVVRSVTTPTRARERPVALYALFAVAGPGEIRWLFACAGGIECGA